MDLVQVECLSKCGFGDQELRNDDREQEGQKRAKKSGGARREHAARTHQESKAGK